MTWNLLEARVRDAAATLRPPLAPGAVPGPVSAAACTVCPGPARLGYARCYQCDGHAAAATGLLADVVVPISYAIKGQPFAGALWRYKSATAPCADARFTMLALLLVFLRDHGACIWRRAGMPPPGRLAIVPTGCGRPGTHPLRRLVTPYLRLPCASLVIEPGDLGRGLSPARFRVAEPVRGASVLLLDDTWVSGGTVQSAAVALKLAGASHVAAVLLGRHLNLVGVRSFSGCLPARRYDPASCPVHQVARPAGRPILAKETNSPIARKIE